MDFIQYDDEAPDPQVVTPVEINAAPPGFTVGLSGFTQELNPECTGSDFLLGC